jgi:hypothetical protein
MPSKVRCSLAGISLFAVGISTAIFGGAPSTTEAASPSLPPPQLGLIRTSPSELLAATRTVLGPTELVAFMTTDGLCVEVDHVRHRSRAGGCAFRPLPPHRAVTIAAQGFSLSAAPGGVTEIIGQVTSRARSVKLEYRGHRSWLRQKVLFGTLSTGLGTEARPLSPRWFSANLPGCLQGDQIRIRVYGQGHVYLGRGGGLPQRYACRSGNGYKAWGAITYGSLPSTRT